MRLRLLALGGIIGPVTFVAAWAFSGAATPGYSPVEDAISRLAAVHAPTQVAMTTGFVVFGVGMIAFGSALRATQAGAAWIAAVATGASTLAVAATPLGALSSDTLHAFFATVGYVTLVAIPLLSAKPLARAGRARWSRAAWLTAAVSGICLVASAAGSAHGFWQRAGLAAGDVWIVARAVDLCLSTAPPPAARAESSP
jgi:hypothetical membrane protein